MMISGYAKSPKKGGVGSKSDKKGGYGKKGQKGGFLAKWGVAHMSENPAENTVAK